MHQILSSAEFFKGPVNRYTRTKLITIGKKAGFLVGDRLKMVKHKAWATTNVVPKSVGSMTMKGQMKPTYRVSLTASLAGENSQSNTPEHTIVSSILTDLIFRRNLRRRTALSGPIIESVKQQNSSNAFPNSISTQYNHKLQHKFCFESLGLNIK